MNPVNSDILIVDNDFRQLVELRQLVQASYDIQVDSCYSLELAKQHLHNRCYQYMLLNGQAFDLDVISQWLEVSTFTGKLILFNCSGFTEKLTLDNICYLDDIPKKSTLRRFINVSKQHSNKNFNERALLQKALDDPETIKFLFQPQYKKNNSELHGFELFTRFSLDSVSLPTNKIIAGIESYGLMAKFCYLYFNKLAACIDSFAHCRLSLNLSINDIETLDLAKLISLCLEKAVMKAEQITVEIVESDFFSMSDRAILALKEIHQLGCAISVDGLKNTWTNLPEHSELIDEIKVSVAVFCADPLPWMAFFESKLAQGIRLIITNIEHKEQLAPLASLPGDIVLQGYYYSHPQDYPATLTLISAFAVFSR